MRGVSVVVLFLAFLQKTIVVSYILSTLIRAGSGPPSQSRYSKFNNSRNDDDSEEGNDYNLS